MHLCLALAVPTAFGFSFVMMRLGLDTMPPLMLSACRYLLAALPLVVLWRLGPPAKPVWIIAYGLAQGGMQFGVLFIALEAGMSPGLGSIVIQAQLPLTILLAAVLFGDRPNRWQIAGILVATGGLAVIGLSLGQGGTVLGFALTVISGLGWALANITAKLAGSDRPLAFLIWASAAAPLPLFALAWVFEGGGPGFAAALASFNQWTALSILYQAVIATVLGFAGWTFLIGRYGASTVAPFGLIVPVSGMAFSALAFGEAYEPAVLAGAMGVLAGLCLVVWAQRWSGRQ